jgi:hypothetical protein
VTVRPAPVVPPKAGTSGREGSAGLPEVPAFAGVTGGGLPQPAAFAGMTKDKK